MIKPLLAALTLGVSLNLIDFSSGSYMNMAQNPIILDMDFCTDVDDAVAVRMATTLDDMNVCTLTAVGVCTTDKTGNDQNLRAVKGLLVHDDHGDVPVGKAHVEEPDESPYWDVCASYAPDEFTVEDSVDLYKEVLNSCYNKVTIVTTGYLTNIQYLLQDSDGYNLVRDNCERIVVTGGTYPEGRDNNFSYTAKAAQASKYVEENCPVQIVYVPNDVGGKFTAGGLIQELSPDDLLAKSLSAFGTQDGRAAWDPTAVFIAAMPEDVSNFAYVPITVEFAVDGSHTFTEVTNVSNSSNQSTVIAVSEQADGQGTNTTSSNSYEEFNYASEENDSDTKIDTVSGNSIKTVSPSDMFTRKSDTSTPSSSVGITNNSDESSNSAGAVTSAAKVDRLAVRYKSGISASQYQDMVEGIISYEYLR